VQINYCTQGSNIPGRRLDKKVNSCNSTQGRQLATCQNRIAMSILVKNGGIRTKINDI